MEIEAFVAEEYQQRKRSKPNKLYKPRTNMSGGMGYASFAAYMRSNKVRGQIQRYEAKRDYIAQRNREYDPKEWGMQMTPVRRGSEENLARYGATYKSASATQRMMRSVGRYTGAGAYRRRAAPKRRTYKSKRRTYKSKRRTTKRKRCRC